MEKLDKETPLMVFVTDSNNKSTYFHYTGDVLEGTYKVKGEDYGKHLFKTLNIKAKSVEKLIESAPTDTLWLGDCGGDTFSTKIDYYFDPKSFAGYVISRLEAERDASNRMYERALKEAKDAEEKYYSLEDDFLSDYENCKKDRANISDKYQALSSRYYDLQFKNDELEEEYRYLEVSHAEKVKMIRILYLGILAFIVFLYLVT